MIAAQILRRYTNNIENIHTKKSNAIQRLTELAYMLDLLRAFFLVNFKSKIDNKRNTELYKEYIFEKIIEMFEKYEEYMRTNHGKDYYDFKDWTATLLLKMKHRTFIYFRVKGLS